MSDQAELSSVADQAIRRLQALADGNGIEPHSIKLIQSDAQVYPLDAVMHFTPFCEAESKHYPGPARRKSFTLFPDINALHADVARRREEFRKRSDWVAEVKKELQAAPGQGWGLDGAKVTLTKRTVVLAASSPCQQCQGSRTITCAQCRGTGSTPCVQCRGQGQEICTTCGGSGQNPQQPGQPCPFCRGTRQMVCRLCRGHGQIICTVCGGRRGTPCPSCQGTGQLTEETQLTFGATTHFELKSGGLPSGLRRSLDRLGIANLSKGHADIEIITPKTEKPEADDLPLESEAPQPRPPEAALSYRAQLPFAELRVDFGGKKAVIGIFGKRNVMIDVPPFLDEALKPWRTKLAGAAQGRSPMDDVIKARALHDALELELQGKGKGQELRRLYPVGLTLKTAEEIARGMHLAIKRTTLRLRAATASVCTLLGGGFFGVCYLSPLAAHIPVQPRWFKLALDFAPPVLAILLGWTLLNSVTRFFLRRNFPNMKIARLRPVGKTGYVMSAAMLLIWFAILVLSPARPEWLPFHL